MTFTCSLLISGQTASGSERLGDGGLEASTPNGTFPDSGFWQPASSGPGAAAICTTTAAHSGNNGLWTFTGNSGSEYSCAPFQQVSAAAGNVFNASAWVRTPAGQPWVAGSRAFIQVDLLDGSSNVVGNYLSTWVTASNSDWTQLQVTTRPAPTGTTRAIFTCFLVKPSGSSGVSVANFDDCSLFKPEALTNGGFEQTFDLPGVGPFPTNWYGEWLGEGGAVAITPADYTNQVLWQFTGTSSNDWWSAIHQQRPASNGQAFSASASVRTPPGQPWVNGSQAYFRVAFLNASNTVIGSSQSPILTAPNPSWTRFSVLTEPAPTNTAYVRFTCYLLKPATSNGQSVVNFDDCSLDAIWISGKRVSARALGVPASQTQVSFELHNTGLAPMPWQTSGFSVPWISASPVNGTIGPLAAQTITLTVDRSKLSGSTVAKTSFDTLNTPSTPIDVYVDLPAAAPPSLPARVFISGQQLMVQDRLANGTLSDPNRYVIKGSGWSPASMGTTGDIPIRRLEFAKWYVADIQLHRAMNANTVYCFTDFGTDATAFAVLDNLYKNGMKAIMTVDEDGTANSNRLGQIVTAYRNHPAILAWAIGNEWNINLYHQTFSNILDAANATESLARQVKALDTNHPVAAIFGDIDIPGLNPLHRSDENTNQPISTERIVNAICPSVDFWGLNIYRGSNFGNVFTQWASISAKPMFFSEFGVDAYRSVILDIIDGAEDEAMQAGVNRNLWNEVVANLSALHFGGVCVGGTVFEWNDEWWKARAQDGASVDVQENLGYYGGQPDGFANEEWFAITTIDRRPRQSYFNFQSDFAAVADLERLRINSITPSNQTFQIQWGGATNTTQYLERATSLALSSGWVKIFTNLPPVNPANQHFNDTNSGPPRFYRVRALP